MNIQIRFPLVLILHILFGIFLHKYIGFNGFETIIIVLLHWILDEIMDLKNELDLCKR